MTLSYLKISPDTFYGSIAQAHGPRCPQTCPYQVPDGT